MRSKDRINIYKDIEYNYLVAKDKPATSEDIDTMNNLTTKPNWKTINGAIIMAPYDGDGINSSFVTGLQHQITGWLIYRRKQGETKQHLVAQVSATHTNVVDYMCANQTDYVYLILPITEHEIGFSLESEPIHTNWWNYSLTGLKETSKNVFMPTSIWTFDANITSTDITQNTDVAMYKTFSRVPKVVKGNSNYQTMGVSCLLGGINRLGSKYTEPIELLNAWQNFVGDVKYCLWKDRKGTVKLGTIDANPTSKYMDEAQEQPTTISFNFIETGDIDQIQVFDYAEEPHNLLGGI